MRITLKDKRYYLLQKINIIIN